MVTRKLAGLLACALMTCVSVAAQSPAQTPEASVERIRGSAQFAAASAFIDSDYDRFVKELVALNEIAAPTFKEKARAN